MVQPQPSTTEALWQINCLIMTAHFFEITSKRRKGFPSETRVKRGVRVVHGVKELREKLGRNDPCPCGSGLSFQKLLPPFRSLRRQFAQPLFPRMKQRGGNEIFRPPFQFHIPLAEQFRRQFAKPQRLVRFQHGIPTFASQARPKVAHHSSQSGGVLLTQSRGYGWQAISRA